MSSRERVFKTLRHEEPDRIPIDFWASKGLRKKIESRMGISYAEFLDRHDVDFCYIGGPEYIGQPLEGAEPGAWVDIWGVPRRNVDIVTEGGIETYAEVTAPPLAAAATAEEIESYPRWPSPDDFRYDAVEAQCDEVRAKGRVAVFMGDRLNRIAQLKPAMYVRGMEEVFIDMAARPGMARAVFARIRRFYGEYLARILEAAKGKIDIILTGDDFGAQEGPLVAPAMWDAFLREGFAEYIDIVHNFGAKAMHHTCGSVVEIIPQMIDCGLDILQSLQPEAAGMDGANLKKPFGSRLSFQGGVSVQKTMTFGTADDIRREVRTLADTLGPGGGYIFCTAHNIQIDAPLSNVEALLSAYHEFGRY